jgi:hypothetical protein
VLEFGINKELVRLIKMCLNETYSKVHVGKHLSHILPIQNGLKQDVLLPLLFSYIRVDLKEIGWEGVDWMHLAQDSDQGGLL